MKSDKSRGGGEFGGSSLKHDDHASLSARWRSLSTWVNGELARMRNERLDRGFLATSHGKNYRNPDSDQPATSDDWIEADPDR